GADHEPAALGHGDHPGTQGREGREDRLRVQDRVRQARDLREFPVQVAVGYRLSAISLTRAAGTTERDAGRLVVPRPLATAREGRDGSPGWPPWAGAVCRSVIAGGRWPDWLPWPPSQSCQGAADGGENSNRPRLAHRLCQAGMPASGRCLRPGATS